MPKSGVTQRLIKSLRPPKLFAPDGNRTIYDRLRGPEEEATKKPVAPRPTGPIARLPVREPTTQACQYSEVQERVVCPVKLGLPEPILDEELTQVAERRDETLELPSSGPAIMQATPSSFNHPLLADPTGVPYPKVSGR